MEIYLQYISINCTISTFKIVRCPAIDHDHDHGSPLLPHWALEWSKKQGMIPQNPMVHCVEDERWSFASESSNVTIMMVQSLYSRLFYTSCPDAYDMDFFTYVCRLISIARNASTPLNLVSWPSDFVPGSFHGKNGRAKYTSLVTQPLGWEPNKPNKYHSEMGTFEGQTSKQDQENNWRKQ